MVVSLLLSEEEEEGFWGFGGVWVERGAVGGVVEVVVVSLLRGVAMAVGGGRGLNVDLVWF